jgi:hypothetical protein
MRPSTPHHRHAPQHTSNHDSVSHAGPGRRRPLVPQLRALPLAAPSPHRSPLTGPQAGSSSATAVAGAGPPPDLLPLALHVLAAHRAAQRTGTPHTLRTRGPPGGAAPAGAGGPGDEVSGAVEEGLGRWAGPVLAVDGVAGGGRGRGLVAARDVAPGELLLVETALGVVYGSELDTGGGLAGGR